MLVKEEEVVVRVDVDSLVLDELLDLFHVAGLDTGPDGLQTLRPDLVVEAQGLPGDLRLLAVRDVVVVEHSEVDEAERVEERRLDVQVHFVIGRHW